MSDTQLQFAKDITAQVKNAWLSGDFLEKVTPTTRNLLTTVSYYCNLFLSFQYIDTNTPNVCSIDTSRGILAERKRKTRGFTLRVFPSL